jgi:hypothetical protein
MAVSANYGSGVFPNGADFPFAYPSSDVKGLFEDLFFSFDDRESYAYPLKISTVVGFQYASYATGDIVISDSNNNTVFDSSTATSTAQRLWGTDRIIYIWEKDDKYLTAVKYYGGGSSYDKSPSFSPVNGELDARTYQKETYKVNSFKLGSTKYQGNISLVAGYNMILSVLPTEDVEGTRKTNRVQVSVVPGAGQGVYPECPVDCISDAILSINAVKPAYNGDFLLAATDCYWFGIDGESDSTKYEPFQDSTLYLKNNCLPCCECDDYVHTYRAIQNLYTRFKDLGDRSMKVRTQHYANTQRWLDGKTCRQNAAVRIFALPASAGTASALVTFCNVSNSSIGPVRIDVNLNAGAKTGVLLDNSTIWYPSNGASPLSIEAEGSWPNYVFRWDNINPGRSAKVKFFVSIDSGDSSDYLAISASVSIDIPGGDLLGTADPYSIGLRD